MDNPRKPDDRWKTGWKCQDQMVKSGRSATTGFSGSLNEADGKGLVIRALTVHGCLKLSDEGKSLLIKGFARRVARKLVVVDTGC